MTSIGKNDGGVYRGFNNLSDYTPDRSGDLMMAIGPDAKKPGGQTVLFRKSMESSPNGHAIGDDDLTTIAGLMHRADPECNKAVNSRDLRKQFDKTIRQKPDIQHNADNEVASVTWSLEKRVRRWFRGGRDDRDVPWVLG